MLYAIPLLGVALRGKRWRREAEPVVEAINRQLSTRPPVEHLYPPEIAEACIWLADRIKKHIGWENSRFILEDPTEILIWPHKDAIDSLALIHTIEAFVERDLPREPQLFSKYPTFRDLAAFVATRRVVT